MASRLRSLIPFLVVVVLACRSKAGPPSTAKEDCSRFVELSGRFADKLPKADLRDANGARDAAKGLRDYRAKLDAIPVNDRTLNNLLVDYSEQLDRMAKALDDYARAADRDLIAAHQKLEAELLAEHRYVNSVNEYCQVEVGRDRFNKDMFKP